MTNSYFFLVQIPWLLYAWWSVCREQCRAVIRFAQIKSTLNTINLNLQQYFHCCNYLFYFLFLILLQHTEQTKANEYNVNYMQNMKLCVILGSVSNRTKQPNILYLKSQRSLKCYRVTRPYYGIAKVNLVLTISVTECLKPLHDR